MKRNMFLTLVGLTALATSALAASPHPTAVDGDNDGYFIATVDINGDGTVDYKDIGVKASEYDCDDTFATVSPLNTEIVGNGIDDDCSSGIPVNHTTGDAKFPVNPDELARWKANWPITWSDLGFVASYTRLSATGSHVTIVKLANGEDAGTFTVEEGYQVGDWITGELPPSREFSAVHIRPDGKLDILSDTEVEYAQAHAAAAKPRPSGLGTASVTKIADERAAAATSGLREEMLEADGDLSDRIEAEATARADGDAALHDEIVDLDQAFGTVATGLADDLESEATARREADEAEAEARALADERIESTATTAYLNANSALHNGVLVEGYGMVGAVGGPPSDARNQMGFGGGAGINFGADLESARVNAFATVIVGTDGGDGPMHSEQVGLESTFALGGSDFHLGPYAAMSSRFSQANALESAVVGRTPLVGVSLAAPFGGNPGHGVFIARVGCGPEFVGVAGDEVNEGVGLGCSANIGIGAGAGAQR